MSQYGEETYDAYTETERKARKPHRCEACGDTISSGHRYFYVSWVFDGSADSVKRCLGCQAVHLHLRHLAPGEMWPSERLDCGEEYTDHWGKAPPEHIAKLAFYSPEEKQSLTFHVFRNHRGDHLVEHTRKEAELRATELGLELPLFAVPGNVGVPLIIYGAERFLYRYPELDDLHYEQTLYQAGLRPIRQPHELRAAREWAVESGRGLLCSGAPVPPLQGPLYKQRVWG